eukprot:TRINITY_DN12839_c0_g1_i1.p2 TRINITY_DN12839_c0_g1~~TRINITY_DN12839_c0_g1_i1.p2  ORF type:complete len:129 (+),score=44.53 TRINITY_DN12839_c0_g1_i1:94-480(+)
MIRRPPRSTLSSSSAASDVYKRQGHKCSGPCDQQRRCVSNGTTCPTYDNNDHNYYDYTNDNYHCSPRLILIFFVVSFYFINLRNRILNGFNINVELSSLINGIHVNIRYDYNYYPHNNNSNARVDNQG